MKIFREIPNKQNEYYLDVEISKEEWKEILNNQNIVNNKAKNILVKFYLEENHKSTCKYIGDKYKLSPQSINAIITNLGRNIQKSANRFEILDENDKKTYWITLMNGKLLKNGLFEWSLKENLALAFEELWIEEYQRFKKLLEYFVSHLEYIQPNSSNLYGFNNYIKPLIEKGTFKNTGQGYKGDSIQNQIATFEYYLNEQICLNIQSHFGKNYTTKKCYLNWSDTGINITANWNNDSIKSLSQVHYIYWKSPPTHNDLEARQSLKSLGLFNEVETTKELKQFFNSFYSELLTYNAHLKNDNTNVMDDIISLLKHKKQIILQGPPGTGKTRLAKQIAEEIIRKNSNKNKVPFLSDEYIYDILSDCSIINSATERTKYKIIDLQDTKCTVELENLTTYDITFNGVKKAYKDTLWLKGNQKGGLDPYNAAISKYIFENQDKSKLPITETKEYSLIQFHPAYTYEDFVRGISVQNNEEGKIEYKTKNRVLAEYALEALKNYNDFHKDKSEYSNEILLNEYFSLFLDRINDQIENSGGFFKLTESVGITILDEDAFRYKSLAQGWNQNGNRMLFKDIKQAFLDGNKERQDFKKNDNLSGLAKHHASYFVRVLNLFQDFLKEENLNFENKEIEKASLKNYVLIIDEINRANLSNVLGELIYALEYRGESVESMYEIDGDRKIILPPNLFIIGTMNTADRSVGQIDYAIRRRFAFVDVLPKVLSETDLNSDRKDTDPELFFMEDAFLKVEELFSDDLGHLSEEFQAKDVQLGHSYFIYTEGNFEYNLEYEIKPILKEYVTDGILKISALPIIEQL